jgi:alkylmercury lyase
MEAESTSALASRLVHYYAEVLDKDVTRLVYHLVRELAKGEPVPPARVAEMMHMSVGEAVRLLEGAIPLDDQGRIIGFGLSLVPTEHQYETNGRTFGLWCAVDAMIFPTIIGQPARIRSSCAVTGEPGALRKLDTTVTIEELP